MRSLKRARDKLIGIIALTDPVFNLTVRDSLIGWSSKDRKQRLAFMLDAHVLGAVPPYNTLLGGKLVACLVRSTDVRDIFRAKSRTECGVDLPRLVPARRGYNACPGRTRGTLGGVISGERKRPVSADLIVR
jgi:Domain of unknown function (DUF4338)